MSLKWMHTNNDVALTIVYTCKKRILVFIHMSEATARVLFAANNKASATLRVDDKKIMYFFTVPLKQTDTLIVHLMNVSCNGPNFK